MQDPERRRDTRHRVDRDFESVKALLTAYLFDVSASGAFVRTAEPLPVGTRLEVRLSVVAGDICTIEGSAVVVRVVTEPTEGPGMGLAFDALTDESRAVLHRLCAARSHRQDGGGSKP